METTKRKRPPFSDADGVKEGKLVKKSAGGDRDLTAVNDDEVEEFFAILRRMREASKCAAAAAAAAAANGGAKSVERARWKPAFVWEDFEGADRAGGDGGGDDKKAAEDGNRRCLDLNADPEPEAR